MKIGRGLAVLFWFAISSAISHSAPLLGGEPFTNEFCLLMALTVAWCNDE